jgi:hypothetical protein
MDEPWGTKLMKHTTTQIWKGTTTFHLIVCFVINGKGGIKVAKSFVILERES